MTCERISWPERNTRLKMHLRVKNQHATEHMHHVSFHTDVINLLRSCLSKRGCQLAWERNGTSLASYCSDEPSFTSKFQPSIERIFFICRIFVSASSCQLLHQINKPISGNRTNECLYRDPTTQFKKPFRIRLNQRKNCCSLLETLDTQPDKITLCSDKPRRKKMPKNVRQKKLQKRCFCRKSGAPSAELQTSLRIFHCSQCPDGKMCGSAHKCTATCYRCFILDANVPGCSSCSKRFQLCCTLHNRYDP